MPEESSDFCRMLLVAVNAKYIHTNLAVRSLAACARRAGFAVETAEFTINQRFDDILAALYRKNAEIVGFSCYLWNISLIRRVCVELKKLRPGLRLWLGGPEVSCNAVEALAQNPAVELVMRGEGEETLPRLLGLPEGRKPTAAIPGAAVRIGSELADGGVAPPVLPRLLPFPYHDLGPLAATGRILYFESQRGCPFSCGYCLPSLRPGVRFMPVEQACAWLDVLLRHRVPLVKFVDRTFNCNPAHADGILRHILANDNGITGFHFEISADILAPSTIALVRSARPGLFQFEIGVQSTREETLRACGRISDRAALFRKTASLHEGGNAHLHLDLIAGLPLEDYASFARSYDEVFAARPDMLQLGFLKVLHGSAMEREGPRYGIVWQSDPPYEVLRTDCLSYDDLLRLKRIAHLTEVYHNSGRFCATLQTVLRHFPSPFAFFEELADTLERAALFDRGWGKYDPYLFLLDFWEKKFGGARELPWVMRHDILLRENAKGIPGPPGCSLHEAHRGKIEAFYASSTRMARFLGARAQSAVERKRTRIEVYPFSPLSGRREPAALLYDYGARDLRGNAAVWEISGFFTGLGEESQSGEY